MNRFLGLLLLLAACATARPTPPPSSGMMEGHRVAGSPYVPLPDETIIRLKKARVRKVQAKVKLCVDQRGVPKSALLKQTTGDAQGDQAIHTHIMGWRYTPYYVAGKPVNVCFNVVLNYTIQ